MSVFLFPAVLFAQEKAPEVRHWGLVPLPVLAYSPDFGGMFGAAAILFHGPDVGLPEAEKTGLRNNTVGLNGIVTTNGSFMASVFATQYFLQDSYRLDASVYGNRIPKVFYGIGPEADTEETYAALAAGGETGLARRLAPNFYVGPLFQIERYAVEDAEGPGPLTAEELRGSSGVCLVSGLGLRMLRDTTGGAFWPTGGTILNGELRWYPEALGSTYPFGLYTLGARKYVSTFRGQVLALQGRFLGSFGDPHFEHYPSLGGGGSFRGLLDRRYRDRYAVSAQGEYRISLNSRFGVVGFLSAGQVADSPGSLDFRSPKLAGGLGLRIALNKAQKLNLRIDVAYAQDGIAPYVDMMEAF